MNIEKTVIKWLTDRPEITWPVFADIPENRPEYYITVERTGGSRGTVRIEEPELLISVNHNSSALEASDMALKIDSMIDNIRLENSISNVERLSFSRLDDLAIKYRRYQIYYVFTHFMDMVEAVDLESQ